MAFSVKESRLFLLLLPPAPSPSSYAAVKAAYHATLFSVLRDLSRSNDNASARVVLEIALLCPHLYGNGDVPRSALYATTQSLVADLYKLICIVSAKEGINVQDADGIDARIILTSHPRHGKSDQIRERSFAEDLQGPIVNLATLARSGRPWETIFTVQSEQGEQLAHQFMGFCKSQTAVRKIRGGIVQVSGDPGVSAAAKASSKHFSVAVGGTWDHLHIGHKLLLTMTAFMVDDSDSSGEPRERSLTCGITGDQLLINKKFAEYLESWSDRQKAVWNFYRSILDFSPPDAHSAAFRELSEPGPNGHAVHITLLSGLIIKCVEIWDPFGPTITDDAISALILSAETRSGGKAVNGKRVENGWPELEVFEVDVLDAEEASDDTQQKTTLDETFQSKLSSTEIRRNQSEKTKARSRV